MKGAEGSEGQRVALFILDGWGVRDEEWGNLILEANTPVMDESGPLLGMGVPLIPTWIRQ